MTKYTDLVARGNPVMDILYTAEGEITSPGGSSATVTTTASKLGMRTGLIGIVGDDDYGRQLIEELEEIGVDLSRLRREGSTTINHIRVTPKDREIFRTEGSASSPLDNKDLECIRASRALYCRAASSQFTKLARFCEDSGAEIFTSLHQFRKDDRVGRGALYSSAVKIIFSNEQEIKDWVIKIPDRLVVLTRGREDVQYFITGKRNILPLMQ